MAPAYICRACRESLKRPHVSSVTRVSQIQRISYASPRSQVNEASSQGERRFGREGRYSRQPLKPEELLGSVRETDRRRDGHRKPAPQPTPTLERPSSIFVEDETRQQRDTSTLKRLKAAANEKEGSALLSGLQYFERLPPAERQTILPSTAGTQATCKILHKLLWRWAYQHFETENVETKPQEPIIHQDVILDLETPAQIVEFMRRLDLMNGNTMSWVVLRLAQWAYVHPVNGVLKPGAHDRLIGETLRIWHTCVKLHCLPNAPLQVMDDDAAFDWSFLPSADVVMKESSRHDPSRLFEHAISWLTPPTGSTNVSVRENSDFTAAAILTLASLSQTGPRSSDLSRDTRTVFPQHAPFIDLLQSVMEASTSTLAPPHFFKTMILKVNERIQVFYRAAIDKYGIKMPITEEVASLRQEDKPTRPRRHPSEENANEDGSTDLAMNSDSLADIRTEIEGDNASAGVYSGTNHWVIFRIKRLGRGMEKQDLSRIEQVWKEVQSYSSPLPIYMYEHLMLAFLAMRRPGIAIEVWNSMTKAGLQPRVHTYVVMMRGTQYGKDVNAMEGLWGRMRSNGLQPDNHAWTTRIYGLFRAGLTHKGRQALQEMGDEWIDAVVKQHGKDHTPSSGKRRASSKASASPIEWSRYTGEVNGVAKPNVTSLNAAVTALAAKSDGDIPSVLKWGRAFGIEPDLTTYNALLNVSMRHARVDEALALLSRMQTKGIQPDGTTSTVLVTALFESGFLDNLSHAEQETKITALLTSIEDGTGVTTNKKSYALIIDRLLKLYSNSQAAQSVLSHMLQKGIQPSPHVYTILMTSYFARDPPDFEAVENLWNQTQNTGTGFSVPLDVVFYDRMVENYATHHAAVGTGPMLMFLQRMSREGKRVSWRALEHVARALAERNDWARLRGIVDDVRSENGGKLVGRAGMLGMSGQRSFWQFVVDTGLLAEEGILDPEVLITTKGGSSFPTQLSESSRDG